MKKTIIETIICGVIGLLLVAPFVAQGAGPDKNPVPIKTPPPVYPSDLKREGISGTVVVLIEISETGKVINASVGKSTDSRLDEAALAAVKKWTFKPAESEGKPVKIKIAIPLRFDLSEE